MNDLSNLLSFVQSAKRHTTRLYLVTRTVKDGISARASVPNKYDYKCYTINTDQSIQKELHTFFVEKMIHCSNEDKYVIENYSIVTDDLEKKILTYTKKERIHSFMHIVDRDLKNPSELPFVNDLADLAEDLWAYIIEIVINGRVICGLRKMSPSKVLVAGKKKSIMASFSMNEQSLVLSRDHSIVFDKNLDAIYVDGKFFVIQKGNFEEIVGLESEYRGVARTVARRIHHSPLFSLNFDLMGEIENKNRFIRKLAKIEGEVGNVDIDRIKKMKRTAEQFGQHFVFKSGKIIVNDAKELDIVIKLLDDYYLLSQQTGKKYEASVKKEL